MSCYLPTARKTVLQPRRDRISHASTTTTTARRTGVSTDPDDESTPKQEAKTTITRASFHVCGSGSGRYVRVEPVPRRIEHDSPVDRAIARTPVCATCLRRRRIRSNSGRGSWRVSRARERLQLGGRQLAAQGDDGKLSQPAQNGDPGPPTPSPDRSLLTANPTLPPRTRPTTSDVIPLESNQLPVGDVRATASLSDFGAKSDRTRPVTEAFWQRFVKRNRVRDDCTRRLNLKSI